MQTEAQKEVQKEAQKEAQKGTQKEAQKETQKEAQKEAQKGTQKEAQKEAQKGTQSDTLKKFIEKSMELAQQLVPKDNDEELNTIKKIEKNLNDIWLEMSKHRDNPDYNMAESKELYNMGKDRLNYLLLKREEQFNNSHKLLNLASIGEFFE